MSKRITGTVWDADAGGMHSVSDSYTQMRERYLRISKHKGTDRRAKPRFEKTVPMYIEGKRYSRNELNRMADAMLRDTLDHPHAHRQHPAILMPEHYQERLRREIYCVAGIPDPEIVAGMYWRTHPQGRSVTSDEQRKRHGSSYYR